jgi:hypothetical protein
MPALTRETFTDWTKTLSGETFNYYPYHNTVAAIITILSLPRAQTYTILMKLTGLIKGMRCIIRYLWVNI